MGRPSGSSWVEQFPGSKDVEDLEPEFRAKVRRFIKAMEAGGATVHVTATLRPRERAYLMHWCWRIAKESFLPREVPFQAGIEIDWAHGSAIEGAVEMVHGFGIDGLRTRPSTKSRHIEGLAIDMTIAWSAALRIERADGTQTFITSLPRDGTNRDLIEVGASYGVIHMLKVDADKVHWSTDGH